MLPLLKSWKQLRTDSTTVTVFCSDESFMLLKDRGSQHILNDIQQSFCVRLSNSEEVSCENKLNYINIKLSLNCSPFKVLIHAQSSRWGKFLWSQFRLLVFIQQPCKVMSSSSGLPWVHCLWDEVLQTHTEAILPWTNTNYSANKEMKNIAVFTSLAAKTFLTLRCSVVTRVTTKLRTSDINTPNWPLDKYYNVAT